MVARACWTALAPAPVPSLVSRLATELVRGLVLAMSLGMGLGLVGCGGGTIGSIGAILGRQSETGAVHVRELPEGNAGDRAGLELGDEIVFVDGKDVRNLDVAGLRRMLRGEPGTKVQLTILRDGQVVRIEVERAALITPTPRTPEGEQRVEE